MRQVSQEGANLLDGNGLPKARYIYVVIGALLVIAITVALINITQLFSSLINGFELLDKIAYELDSERSVNTIVTGTVAGDQIANTEEPMEDYSVTLNEKRDEPGQIKKSKNSEKTLENKIVPVDRGLDEIIDDLFQSNGVIARRYLDELWRRAGDLQVPDDAIVALQQVAMSDDENLAKRAEFAYNDLMEFKSRLEKEKYQRSVTLTISPSNYDSPDRFAQEITQVSIVNNDELIMDEVKPMLHSHQRLNRSMAVDKLNLLRTPEALSLLINVAYQEYDATIRYKAIKGIWVQAADGVGNSTEAMGVLRRAVYDEDQSIANLARSALDDLTKYRSSAD